jgi:hypothetical protein
MIPVVGVVVFGLFLGVLIIVAGLLDLPDMLAARELEKSGTSALAQRVEVRTQTHGSAGTSISDARVWIGDASDPIALSGVSHEPLDNAHGWVTPPATSEYSPPLPVLLSSKDPHKAMAAQDAAELAQESLVTPIALGAAVMIVGVLVGSALAAPGLIRQWRYSRSRPPRPPRPRSRSHQPGGRD